MGNGVGVAEEDRDQRFVAELRHIGELLALPTASSRSPLALVSPLSRCRPTHIISIFLFW